jgi:hypothetical protein
MSFSNDFFNYVLPKLVEECFKIPTEIIDTLIGAKKLRDDSESLKSKRKDPVPPLKFINEVLKYFRQNQNQFSEELPDGFWDSSEFRAMENAAKEEPANLEKIWATCERLENLLFETIGKYIDKKMLKFTITEAIILIQDGYNMYDIFQVLKETKQSVTAKSLFAYCEGLFSTINNKIDKVKEKIIQFHQNTNDINLIEDLNESISDDLDDLKEWNKKAWEALIKIEDSLQNSVEKLNDTKKTTISSGISNFVNFASRMNIFFYNYDVINETSRNSFLLKTFMYFGASFGNAWLCYEANNILSQLEKRQKELVELKLVSNNLEEEIKNIQRDWKRAQQKFFKVVFIFFNYNYNYKFII